jgi:hypothetical protein
VFLPGIVAHVVQLFAFWRCSAGKPNALCECLHWRYNARIVMMFVEETFASRRAGHRATRAPGSVPASALGPARGRVPASSAPNQC